MNQSISWNCFEYTQFQKSKWIYRSNSILTFLVQNLFIIIRFKHIESKKSIDSIIHNQNNVFDVFVRVHRSENTTSHKMQFEQWIRINSILSKIKTYAKISTMKFANFRIMNLTNFELNEHTNRSMNTQQIWRTCEMFDKFAMNHEHAISHEHAIKFVTEHEQTFEKQFYRIWNRFKKHVVQTSNIVSSNLFNSVISYKTSIYNLINIVRQRFVICIIQILWLRMNNEFYRHEFLYDWNMRHATNFA